MKEILKDIYQHSQEMQKIADTKNAGLIAFNGAVILASLKFVTDVELNIFLVYYLYFVLFCCIISIFINLTAIVAQLKHKELELSNHKSDNLLFFGTVANQTPDGLLDKLKAKYQLDENTSEYLKDLSKQAIVMSQISLRKFKLFNTAFLWTIAAVATPLSVLTFLIFYNPNK